VGDKRVKAITLAVSVILVGILIISSIVFSSSTSITINTSGSIRLVSPLHVEGQYIKDDQNNTVILRGVNCGGGGDAPDGMWSGHLINSYSTWQSNQAWVTSQLDGIKSWGCNAIRYMTAPEYWINNTGNQQQMTKDLANLLASRGMYLIFEGGWSVRAAGNSPQQDPLPYPPYQITAGASQVLPTQQAYIDYMVNICVTLEDYGNVIVGLWNEPGGGAAATDSLTGANTEAEWFGVAQRVINNARGNGSSLIILAQWGYGCWCNLKSPPPAPPASPGGSAGVLDWVYRYPLNGSNIAYQTHLYDPIQNDGTYAQMQQGLADCWFQYVTQNMSKPVLVGEIGSTGGSDDTQFNYTLLILNGWNIGYTAWIWRAGVSYALITTNSAPFTPTSTGTILIDDIANANSLLSPS
jgi:hypothetical protein